MDSEDKTEEWQLSRVGRKWIGSGNNRSRMRKEKDNVRTAGVGRVWVREGGGSRTDMGHSDIRQMAQTAQLCLLYSHCSSKNSHKIKMRPAACGLFCRWMSACMCSCDFGFYLHTRLQSSIFREHWYHTLLCLNSQPQSNCLLFSRGHGLLDLQSTQ